MTFFQNPTVLYPLFLISIDILSNVTFIQITRFLYGVMHVCVIKGRRALLRCRIYMYVTQLTVDIWHISLHGRSGPIAKLMTIEITTRSSWMSIYHCDITGSVHVLDKINCYALMKWKKTSFISNKPTARNYHLVTALSKTVLPFVSYTVIISLCV